MTTAFLQNTMEYPAIAARAAVADRPSMQLYQAANALLGEGTLSRSAARRAWLDAARADPRSRGRDFTLVALRAMFDRLGGETLPPKGRGALLDALGALEFEDRRLVVLSAMLRCTNEEAAFVLRKPAGAVDDALPSAVARMMRCYKEQTATRAS